MPETAASATPGPRSRRALLTGLGLCIVLQTGVLAAEYLGSVWPLWYGSPVRLETAPIDPRSLFRGNYVRLNYAISRVDAAGVALRVGDRAYVRLRRQGDLWVAAGVQAGPPADGPFIRGRVVAVGDGHYRLRYGIEALFLPKARALQVEQALREGAVAEVYLLGNGRAAVAGLDCGDGGCG